MVIDPKIESFSHNIFQHLYYESKKIPKPEGYELPTIENYRIGNAIVSRQELFRWHYKQESSQSYEKWKNSVTDFYTHLCELFSDFEDYLNPNIFDKVLIVCTYIQEMATISHLQNNNIYLEFPSCFARYVDSFFKDELYAKGSWDALLKHSWKYCIISGYILDLLPSYKLMPSKEIFFTALIRRIERECNFKHLVELLREHALKYKADYCICIKCLSFCDLSSDILEDLKMSDSLSTFEIFLQVCLNLLTSSEIKELDKRLHKNLDQRHDERFPDDIIKHDPNCKYETWERVKSPSKCIEPCLKCFYCRHYTLVNKLTHTTVENKQLLLRTAVAIEIFKKMFIYNRAKLLEQQHNQNFCAWCLRSFEQFVQKSTTELMEVKNWESPILEHHSEYDLVIDPNMDLDVASITIL